jgi:hypothetical protein
VGATERTRRHPATRPAVHQARHFEIRDIVLDVRGSDPTERPVPEPLEQRLQAVDFIVGSAMSLLPTLTVAAIGYDVKQIVFDKRLQSRTEFRDDLAAVAVAGSVAQALVTRNFSRMQRQVTHILCK